MNRADLLLIQTLTLGSPKEVPPPPASSPMYLVESKQIMSQPPEEASVGVVPQQGAVPPVLQGGLVGHVPDAQVLGLDVVVARVLQRDTHSASPAKDPEEQL